MFHFNKPEFHCGMRIKGSTRPEGIIISPTAYSCQVFKFPQSTFNGWTDWINETIGSVGIQTLAFSDSPSRVYAGLNNGIATNTMFRSWLKSTQTWSQHTTPFSHLGIRGVKALDDDDTVFIGSANAGNAVAYKFTHTGSTFTNINWPGDSSDNIFIGRQTPDQNNIYISNQARAASGEVELYVYDVSLDTWTMIGGNGLNGSWNLNANSSSMPDPTFGPEHIYAISGGGSINHLSVWRAPLDFSAWTEIGGGGGINSSWATGTKRNGRIIFHEGKLYAGIGGSTAGDAEVWVCENPDTAPSWTQIGGDSIGSSWSGFSNASNITAHGDFVVIGLSGASAGNSDVWAYSISTGVWEQIGGDSIRDSWPGTGTVTKTVRTLYVDRESNLWAAPDNNNDAPLLTQQWYNPALL